MMGAGRTRFPDLPQTKNIFPMEAKLQLSVEQMAMAEAIADRISFTQKTVLTTAEAAAYLGVSLSYLYKLTMRQQIPHSKPLGKMCYFSRLELEAWLMRNRVATSTELHDRALDYCRTRINKKGGK
jgi:excisionase family DNA binding protein